MILIIISGMAMGFNWVLLFEAYKYTTISIATLTYYFAPIIVTIVCPIIFKEKLGINKASLKEGAKNTGATLVAIPAAVTAVNSDLKAKEDDSYDY